MTAPNQCYADPGVKETLRRRFLPGEELRCGLRKLEHGIRLGHAQQNLEQHQPALQVYGDQEIFLGVRLAIFTQLRGKLRMREQVTDLVSATLHGMHQYPSKLMDYLRGYAADRPCDHRLFFP